MSDNSPGVETDRAPERFDGFVYLRAIAILAVVYIHGCDTNPIARHAMKWLGFAVPCFFMMGAFLAQRSFLHKDIACLSFVRRKFARLAPPFLAWSTLYLLVRYLKASMAGSSVESGVLGCILWGDASYQLYFVPMLFYCFVVWAGLMAFAKRAPTTSMGLFVATAVFLVAVGPVLDRYLPNDRWFIAPNLAWFPIGMAIAIGADRWKSKWLMLKWPAVVSLFTAYGFGWSNVYYLSIIGFVVATTIRYAPGTFVKTLANISFGIYLVHVLIIETMQFVLPKFSFNVESLSVTLMITLCAAIGSVAICWPFALNRRTRWLVT